MTADPHNNIAAVVTAWAARAPTRTAFVFPRGVDDDGAIESVRVTFGALDDEARRLAAGLVAAGLQPGARVLLMIPISRALYTTLIAVVAAGATAVFVDPWMPRPHLRAAVRETAPQFFIGVPRAHLLRLVIPEIRRIRRKLSVGAGAIVGHLLGGRVEDVGARQVAPLPLQPVRDVDEALITFTTGSTGAPKGSARTHGFLRTQAAVLNRMLPRRDDDVDMPSLPIFGMLGLSTGVTSVFAHVDPRAVSSFDPAVVVRQIADEKVTIFGGSPALLTPIARYCVHEKITLPTVRGIYAGGATVAPELLAMMRRVFPRAAIHVLFGSTEVEPVAEITADEVLDETAALTREGRGVCLGRPHPDLAVRILPPRVGAYELAGSIDDVACPIGVVGELVVAGPHVQHAMVSEEAWRQIKIVDADGRIWHRMGDMAFLDERGRLWLVGRVQEQVETSSGVLYPLQVEPVIETLPLVGRAALVAVDDVPVVVVTKRDVATDDGVVEAAVLELCRRRGLAIERVVVRASLPVDPRHNAKIQRVALARQLSSSVSSSVEA